MASGTGRAAATEGNAAKGVVLVVMAVLAFALVDILTKHLAMRYPIPIVQAVRYLVSLAFLFAAFGPRHGAGLFRTRRTGLVVLRALSLAAGSLTMGLALRLMPVGETIAIVYLAPFAVMLLAVPLLGEKVSLTGWIGAALGFLGVLMIVRPGSGLDALGVVFALINAGCATAYHLMTRLLTRSETTLALLLWISAVGSAVFCVLSLPYLAGFAPPAVDLAWMGLLGALALGGHFLFTAAYREAPASLLAPVNYMHLVFATGLGWLIFGHLPDGLTLAGIALVAVAGAGVALRARLQVTPTD